METIHKPWGKEEILETNEKYTVKKLYMNEGCQCSLQYHRFKKETIYCLSGRLSIYIDGYWIILNAGDHRTIEPMVVHRMGAVGCDAIYLECSTSELDDVIRMEDDYGRK